MRSSFSVGIEAAFRVPCRMRQEHKVFYGRRDDRTETLEAAGCGDSAPLAERRQEAQKALEP